MKILMGQVRLHPSVGYTYPVRLEVRSDDNALWGHLELNGETVEWHPARTWLKYTRKKDWKGLIDRLLKS
jgi:hypothetical protein